MVLLRPVLGRTGTKRNPKGKKCHHILKPEKRLRFKATIVTCFLKTAERGQNILDQKQESKQPSKRVITKSALKDNYGGGHGWTHKFRSSPMAFNPTKDLGPGIYPNQRVGPRHTHVLTYHCSYVHIVREILI